MDSAPESDGDAASKRPRVEMEIDGGDGVIDDGESAKKRRRENGENEEMEMKRVAEIVLVLSAMGKMRGGKDPTAVEKAMMAEAKEKIVALCEQLAPKDIMPRESFGVVIDDLGLNRLKEQRLGFRTPKLSISDKIAFTKRRMEESKTFVAQPASYPSQSLQNTGVAGENRVMPPNVRMFSSGKAGHMPVSSQSTPAVHVSSAASTPPSFRPPGIAAPAAAVSSSMPNNIAKDSPQMVPPRVDRAHIRPDGRPNGPSFVTQVPVSASVDQRVVRTTPVSLQPQSGPWVNMGMQKKIPDHLPGRSDGNANFSAPQMTAQAAAGQIPKSVVSQTAPGSKPTVQHHHPMQGMHFAHASPVFNHHLEISKVVQKVLDPKLAERPAWTPPSRDYMNRAVLCQFCKVAINGVENVLVCDACEKGFHVGCLQSYNAKGIPRGEWHCPRCLAMNRGKPFPPKYGRVTRNMNASKASSSTAGFLLSSDKKPEAADGKVNQPNTITNGKSDFKTHPPNLKVAESSSESSLQHGNMINQKDMCAVTKMDEVPNSVKSPIDTNGALVETSLATSTGSSSDKTYQQAVKSEISSSEDRAIPKIESKIPFVSRTMNTSNALPTLSNHNNVDQERLSNGAEASLYQHYDCNGVVECDKNCDEKRHEKDVGKENILVNERAHDQYRELIEGSESSLHNVSWIGDTARVVDEKKFFQSCCINGVVYKVQDYALFRSSNDKLAPLKIQGMWEDTQTSLKWLFVHKCYFPDDLPKEVGRPGAPQSNEVYESTRDSNVRATIIEGPCEVLPFRKFGEDTERSNEVSQTNDRTGPIFVRNWFYDESKRAFCPSAS